MCGISGFVVPRCDASSDTLTQAARQMADELKHRGPDDFGEWVDPECGIALSHRRLSIIDLSAHGHQPMVSQSGRYVVVYNGELYNFRDVRRELEALGSRFAGHSDTEVLLAAIEQWGLEAAVQQFTGMFAFALWDRRERRLHLVRDRIGEKPLYYGWQGGVFLFASELKALRVHPNWQAAIDRDALALYLRFGYVPAPYSIYEGIAKLPPGSIATIALTRAGSNPEPHFYWSSRHVSTSAASDPLVVGDEEAINELERLILAAVSDQMIADVPLGAFLSGGVDSSTIVALMQVLGSQPVRTFTIGVDEPGYNEAEHAKAVAQHLGTDHTELYVTPREVLDVVPFIPRMYDEPFADPSQIPTHLVSRLARQHVTVSLSGDGGDELFGGYARYFAGPKMWDYLRRVPPGGRRAASRLIDAVGAARWDRFATGVAMFAGAGRIPPRFGEKMTKLAGVMRFAGPELIHKELVSVTDPASLLGGAEPATLLDSPEQWPRLKEFAERMMYVDALTYLPDDIMVKVDRASMACSLESRAPLLDHRVVEFAWRLPLHLKLRDGVSKWILRQVLYRHVPRELIERPKAGFAIPVGRWLRGPLKEWAAELLDEARMREQGFFDPNVVARLWREHQSGRFDRQLPLWAVLMFQAWLEAETHSPAALATN